MKEQKIYTLFGMDIIARVSADWPKELAYEEEEQLRRAHDFILKLIEEELRPHTREEIRRELYD